MRGKEYPSPSRGGRASREADPSVARPSQPVSRARSDAPTRCLKRSRPGVAPAALASPASGVPIPGLPRSGTRNAPKRTDTRSGHRPRPTSASDPRGSSPPLRIRAAAARRQVVCKLPGRCRTARWPLSRSRERLPLSAIGNRRRKPEPARASWGFGAGWHGPWNRGTRQRRPTRDAPSSGALRPCPKSTPSSSSTTRSTS
jgi:hypothetical protein